MWYIFTLHYWCILALHLTLKNINIKTEENLPIKVKKEKPKKNSKKNPVIKPITVDIPEEVAFTDEESQIIPYNDSQITFIKELLKEKDGIHMNLHSNFMRSIEQTKAITNENELLKEKVALLEHMKHKLESTVEMNAAKKIQIKEKEVIEISIND